MSHGGLQKDSDGIAHLSDNIAAFFDVDTHSNGDGPFGSVDIHSKMQFNYDSQGESYFCSKQCVIDWFTRKLKDLPEPGTEIYEPDSET